MPERRALVTRPGRGGIGRRSRPHPGPEPLPSVAVRLPHAAVPLRLRPLACSPRQRAVVRGAMRLRTLGSASRVLGSLQHTRCNAAGNHPGSPADGDYTRSDASSSWPTDPAWTGPACPPSRSCDSCSAAWKRPSTRPSCGCGRPASSPAVRRRLRERQADEPLRKPAPPESDQITDALPCCWAAGLAPGDLTAALHSWCGV